MAEQTSSAIHSICKALVAALVAFGCLTGSSALAKAPAVSTSLEGTPPKFEIVMTLQEFAMFASALTEAVEDQSGRLPLDVAVVGTGKGAAWQVRTDQAMVFTEVRNRLTDQSARLLEEAAGDEGLKENAKATAQALSGLMKALRKAVEQPVFELRRFRGTVALTPGGFELQTDAGKLGLDTQNPTMLAKLKDKVVLVDGRILHRGRLQLEGAWEVPTRKLDLVILPDCPGSQAILAPLRVHLAKLGAAAPELRLHYLFYQTAPDGANVRFTTLHGDSETTRTMAQIAIRDKFPKAHDAYVTEWLKNPAKDWREAALAAGLTDADVAGIEKTVREEGPLLAASEHESVSGLYGVTESVPHLFWEGEEVEKLQSVPALKDFAFQPDPRMQCGQ